MNKKFYKNNRLRLLNTISDKKCMILLSSGYEMIKSADENYEFQVNNNFYYLTGIDKPQVYLILLKNEDSYQEILYIDEYDEFYNKWIGHQLTKKEASNLSGIFQSNIEYRKHFESDIKMFLKEYPHIYLDLEPNDQVHCSSFGFIMKEKLSSTFSTIKIKDIYPKIIQLRMVKQNCEIKAIQSAIETTQHGIEALMRNSRSGIYEYQLEAFYDYVIKNEGNKKTAFKTIAASGENATILHYSANHGLLQENELILFDLGCKEQGYCSDITRTFPINGKFTKLQRTIYEIVLNANKVIQKRARAGMTLLQLQTICIQELTKGCLKANLIQTPEEIKKYYFHGVSHPIGLDTHDPFLRTEPLPRGAVISNEPGLYFPQYKIGVRIEDDLLLLKTKAINLSSKIIKEIDEIENFMKK